MTKRLQHADVERLLETFYANGTSADEPCEECASVASALAEDTPDTDVAAAAAEHLATCSECAADVLLLGNLAARGLVPAHAPASTDRRHDRPSRWVPVLSHLTAAFAAAAAALLVVFLVPSGEDSTVPEERGTLVPKGPTDVLSVAVRRGDAEIRIQPEDKLVDGDLIGFFYTSKDAGYLAIYHVDEQRVVTRLYPTPPADGAISAGSDVRLPDGGMASPGRGCEWFVGVFSNASLGDLPVASLRRAGQNPSRCGLAVELPEARHVHAIGVRR